ncbi:MAG TPA: PEP-CTERM sorting domain-containing protein [Telluria sp.]|nr:PEP-CTERM sorting domain-containing protein [Telluria sp.]
MKLSKVIQSALIVAAAFTTAGVQASTVTLPEANELSAGTYNDFTVYSLDLLKKCYLDVRCQPQAGIPVASSPGTIKDQAIVLETADGQSNFTNPFPAGTPVDEIMLTPTGNQSTTYAMGSFVAEPGGLFTGDQANRWEIRLDVLQDYLDGHDLVFMFDNNQAQSRTAQTIFLWGQARIVDANGNTVGGCFELSNFSTGCQDTGGNPAPANSAFVEGATEFCVDKIDGLAYAGTGNNQNGCAADLAHPSGGYWVVNNLGTNIAEFAAFNQALHDAAAQTAGNDQLFLQLNIKYYNNDGGAEQLWICSDCTIGGDRQVPEPSSLPLFALGLLIGGISFLRARRR